jgi:alkylated DNA repair dioxygenase AlkB
VSLVVQPSLFGYLGELGVAELGAAVARRPLSDGAWVDLRPAFITAADELFDALASVVPWHEERMHIYDSTVRVPRLLARYSQGESLPHPVLDEARSALNAHYAEELGEPFVSAGLCLYRDGSDSVAWHGDRIARESERDTMVAIVSLGATRPFGLRPKSGGPGLRLSVGHGDLLVMGGTCQRTWLHSIPKVTGCLGARISIQFRPDWGGNLPHVKDRAAIKRSHTKTARLPSTTTSHPPARRRIPANDRHPRTADHHDHDSPPADDNRRESVLRLDGRAGLAARSAN